MASSWFLKLVFKCLHHLAWPLIALAYPMCASVQAIETDSYEQTKDLISYWILLSLIYLFEYGFMSLLAWFHIWPYIKLMIIFWLIIPDFGRASYVYNNLICSMKPQIVTYWRKCFVEKDNFLMHAERYMKENGTEALEKLIASKNTMCRPDAKVIPNEFIATGNNEMLKDIPVMPKIEPSQNASLDSATVETKGTAESDRAGGEVPQSSTSTQKEVQNQWTCDLCLLTITCENSMTMHLNGKRHRAALQKQKNAEVKNTDNKEILKTNGERLKTEHEGIKDLEAIEKKETPSTKQNTMHRPDAELTNEIIDDDNKEMLKTIGERLESENNDIKDLVAIEKKEIPATKQRTYANIVSSQTTSSTIVETKEIIGRDTAGGELPQSFTQKEVQKEWTCALCLVKTSSEITLISHLNGRRHRNACEAAGLKVAKKLPATQKNGLPEPFRMINSRLICKVCNVMLPSEEYMDSHIKGWKHLSNMKT